MPTRMPSITRGRTALPDRRVDRHRLGRRVSAGLAVLRYRIAGRGRNPVEAGYPPGGGGGKLVRRWVVTRCHRFAPDHGG